VCTVSTFGLAQVIKNNKDFLDQSLDEIKLLRYINAVGDPDEHNVLRLYEYFYHKEHLFLVTEVRPWTTRSPCVHPLYQHRCCSLRPPALRQCPGVCLVPCVPAVRVQLLKDNLYEFQKFLMTGKEPPFFTLPRLQVRGVDTWGACACVCVCVCVCVCWFVCAYVGRGKACAQGCCLGEG
jgi:hypothetical protein